MANDSSRDKLSGILLIAAAALAMVLDNSPLASTYDQLILTHLEVRVGDASIDKPLLLWINDGLMAIFFLLIGLELKREILVGEMRSISKVTFPLAGAIGGIAVPAALFWFINRNEPSNLNGWAVPTATDIAFALGILALIGKHLPPALRTFLMTLAVFDDVAAIVIIAAFYTEDIAWSAKGLALGGLVVLVLLNRFRVTRLGPYMLVGLFVWVCVLKSGVHATLAGVAIGLCIPLSIKNKHGRAPLDVLEDILHGYVSFLILPVFAFANAGVYLGDMTMDKALNPLTVGVSSGLLFGKLIGVTLFVWIAVRLGVARKPEELTWRHVVGASLLAGVGFTMSLFIGGLAFDSELHASALRIGVLSGSLAAGILGFALLRGARPAKIG